MPGMNPAELERVDAALRLHIDVLRHSSHVEARVLALLENMRQELLAKLASGDLTGWGKARLNAMLKDAATTIDGYYAQAQAILSPTYASVTAISATQTAAGIASAASIPSRTVLEAIASNVMVEGSPMKAWWAKMAADQAFKFSAAVRQGILAGDTQAELFKRVNETVDLAGRNSRALVHTSVSQVLNDARLATLKANADIAPTIMWISALDGNVCIRCGARDGLEWDTLTLEPIGHNIPFENIPLHVNCRCITSGVTRMVKYALEHDIGARASQFGTVKSSTTFEEFLSRQSPEFVAESLGKNRAEMFLAGKLSLRDLTSGNGRPLTLEQLHKKYH